MSNIRYYLLLLIVLFSWNNPANSAVRLTDNAGISDQPHAALDGNGNLHLVWTDDSHSLAGTVEIYYKMIGASGQTLIGDTLVSDNDGSDSFNPSLNVDTSGRILLVWQDRRTGSDSIYFARLNPSLDDQDGSPADTSILKDVDDLQVSAESAEQISPNAEFEPGGGLSLVWTGYQDLTIHFLKIDESGAVLLPERIVNPDMYAYHAFPDIALDPSGNAHIVWADWTLHPNQVSCEVYYALVNGSTGEDIIGPTLLTADDLKYSSRPSVGIDEEGTVNVVWQDKRLGTGESGSDVELYLMKLDPGLAAGDGSAAAMTDIKILYDKPLTPDDSVMSFQPHITAAPDGLIHAVYHDPDKAGLRYLVSDSQGDVLGSSILSGSVAFSKEWNDPHVWNNAQVISGTGEVRIFWSDESFGNPEVVSVSSVDLDADADGITPRGGDCDDYNPALNNLDGDGDGITTCQGDTNAGVEIHTVPVDDSSGNRPVGVFFNEVTAAGSTSLTLTTSGSPPPSGFITGKPAIYYDLKTSAANSGPVTVCVDYSDQAFNNENNIGLYHEFSGAGSWTEVTTSHDTLRNLICGQVSSFSSFAVFEPASKSSGGGCFIATAAYGSSMEPEVDLLRGYRDRYLKHRAWGRLLLRLYYKFSPAPAAFIADKPVLKGFVRAALHPIVEAAKNAQGNEGPIPVLIGFLMLVPPPVIGMSLAVNLLRRRRARRFLGS